MSFCWQLNKEDAKNAVNGGNQYWIIATKRSARVNIVSGSPAISWIKHHYTCCFWLVVVFQLEYPVLWTCKEFCEEFSKLLDHLHVDRVSIFLLLISAYFFCGMFSRSLSSSWWLWVQVGLWPVCFLVGTLVWSISWWLSGTEVCRVLGTSPSSSVDNYLQFIYRHWNLWADICSPNVSYSGKYFIHGACFGRFSFV